MYAEKHKARTRWNETPKKSKVVGVHAYIALGTIFEKKKRSKSLRWRKRERERDKYREHERASSENQIFTEICVKLKL